MNLFSHSLWASLRPFARISTRGGGSLDLLQLPDDLRAQALSLRLPCAACGSEVNVFRARLKSKRSRIANQTAERRLFYAATCPISVNKGCTRSRQARDAKRALHVLLEDQKEQAPAIRVQVLDASGMVLYEMSSEVKEAFEAALPKHAASLRFLPAGMENGLG